MFRSMSGYKAQYQDLTLLVISEFNEWRVMLHAPAATIQGTRQFSEAKAKEHALAVAQSYIRERRHEEISTTAEVAWSPTASDDWLVWT